VLVRYLQHAGIQPKLEALSPANVRGALAWYQGQHDRRRTRGDQVAMRGQGPIVDRAAEHLGRSDRALIALRQIWARPREVYGEPPSELLRRLAELRLIYADWLEEHGDPQRAEFIRAQIRLEGDLPPDERRALELKRAVLSELGQFR